VQSFSLADMDKFGTSSLITRSTNDVTQLQNYVMAMIRMVMRAPIMAVGAIITALYDKPHTIQNFAHIPSYIIPVDFYYSEAHNALLPPACSKSLTALLLVMREKLTGVRVITRVRQRGLRAQKV
jgi:ATP-binding cassette subfamily B protein